MIFPKLIAEIEQMSTFELLVAAIFMVSFFVFLYYYCFLFMKVVFYKLKKRLKGDIIEDSPVSIVVIVRNNLDFLTSKIHILFQQEYSAPYQVVLVNYDMQDAEIDFQLKSLKALYPNLYVTNIKEGEGHMRQTKKLAYTIGAKAAIYENLLFLLPEAAVTSTKWLHLMAGGFSVGKIVSGYCRLKPQKGFHGAIMRCHNILNSLLHMGCCSINDPYMASKYNMGCTKSLFFKSDGLSKQLRFDGGEDDIFIQGMAKYGKSALVLTPRSSVELTIEDDWDTYNYLRIANSYSHRFYPLRFKMYLFLEPFASIIFWSCMVLLLLWLSMMSKIVVGAIVLLRLIITTLVLLRLGKRSGEKIPYLTYFLYALIQPFDSIYIWMRNRLNANENLWV